MGKIFKYLGEYKMWEDEIAKADDYERHADSFFVNWVDPVKLEEKLKFLKSATALIR